VCNDAEVHERVPRAPSLPNIRRHLRQERPAAFRPPLPRHVHVRSTDVEHYRRRDGYRGRLLAGRRPPPPAHIRGVNHVCRGLQTPTPAVQPTPCQRQMLVSCPEYAAACMTIHVHGASRSRLKHDIARHDMPSRMPAWLRRRRRRAATGGSGEGKVVAMFRRQSPSD